MNKQLMAETSPVFVQLVFLVCFHFSWLILIFFIFFFLPETVSLTMERKSPDVAFAVNHFGNTPWLIPGYRIEKRRIYTEKTAKREAFL